MPSFSLQIAEWVAKTKGDMDKIVRFALMSIDGKLVQRSPVGDAKFWIHPAPKGYAGGRFRGAWIVSQWTPNASDSGLSRVSSGTGGFIDKDGSATLAAHAGVISEARSGNIYYLYNPMPYGKRIEEGWSSQAPAGVVALTVVEWNNIVEAAVNGVRSGTSAEDFAQGYQSYSI